jgi:hypothetical protein
MNMTLDELVQRQKTLNSSCPCYPDGEDLLWDLMVKICDMSNAANDLCLRSHQDHADEIADILCFLLTGCLSEDAAKHPVNPDFWDKAWGCCERQSIGLLVASIGVGAYTAAIMHLVFFANHSFGLTQNEIEEAYHAVSQMNCEVWADNLEDD